MKVHRNSLQIKCNDKQSYNFFGLNFLKVGVWLWPCELCKRLKETIFCRLFVEQGKKILQDHHLYFVSLKNNFSFFSDYQKKLRQFYAKTKSSVSSLNFHLEKEQVLK